MDSNDYQTDDEITRFYNQGLEAKRLSEPRGALEFARTQEIIARYIPKPPADVWDIGGGPGRYAHWLAGEGYQVHLLDPVQLHLEQARDGAPKAKTVTVQSYVRGDARKLPIQSDQADAALLLGPLYHLTERKARVEALQEARRALKPGGVVFAVAISRYASTMSGLFQGFFEDPTFVDIAHQDVQTGQHRNYSANSGYFTTSFFHHPDEMRDEILAAGFKLEALLAVEGPAVFLQDLD